MCLLIHYLTPGVKFLGTGSRWSKTMSMVSHTDLQRHTPSGGRGRFSRIPMDEPTRTYRRIPVIREVEVGRVVTGMWLRPSRTRTVPTISPTRTRPMWGVRGCSAGEVGSRRGTSVGRDREEENLYLGLFELFRQSDLVEIVEETSLEILYNSIFFQDMWFHIYRKMENRFFPQYLYFYI